MIAGLLHNRAAQHAKGLATQPR